MLIRTFLWFFLLTASAHAATNIVATLSDDVSLNHGAFQATIWDGTTLTNETNNFTRSGSLTTLTYTLMAANRDATFNYDENIALNLTIADSSGNYMDYTLGTINWTVEAAPVDPVTEIFGDGPSGDRGNWTEKVWDGTSGIWGTFEDNFNAANVEYGTTGSFDGGKVTQLFQPGAIAMYPVTISGNSVIEFQMKVFGDAQSGTTPIDITFGTGANQIALSGKESTFVKLLAINGDSRFGYMDPATGERQTLTRPAGKPLTDNAWHNVRIEVGAVEGADWTIKIDEGALWTYTSTVQGDPAGFFWFGSDDGSVRIDGLVINGIEQPPIVPETPVPKGNMSATGSQVRKSDRWTMSGPKSGRIRFT